MGALLFLRGAERIVYPHSQLMFHDYNMHISGKVSKVEQEFEYKSRVYKKELKRIIKPHLKKNEWKRFKNGKDIWFDAHEMCSRGIATKININGVLLDAEKYVKETNGK